MLVDLDLLYGKVKFVSLCILMGIILKRLIFQLLLKLKPLYLLDMAIYVIDKYRYQWSRLTFDLHQGRSYGIAINIFKHVFLSSHKVNELLF